MPFFKLEAKIFNWFYSVLLIVGFAFVILHFDSTKFWGVRQSFSSLSIFLASLIFSLVYARFVRYGIELLFLPAMALWTGSGLGVEAFATAWTFVSLASLGKVLVNRMNLGSFSFFLNFFVGASVSACLLPAAVNLTHQFLLFKTLIMVIPIFSGLYPLPYIELSRFKRENTPVILLCSVISCLSAFCLIPDITADSQVMHLSIPFSLNNLGWANLRPLQQTWSYFPQGVDFLFGLATENFDLYTPKMVNLFSLIFFAFAFCELFFEKKAVEKTAAAALFLCLACPVVVQQFAQSFIDLIWAEFTVLGIVCCSLSETDKRGKLSVLFFAAACASKLFTVCYIFPALPFIFRVTRRSKWTENLTLTIVLLSGLSWLWLGYAKTGNPFFPLLNNVFKSKLYPIELFEDPRWHQRLSFKTLFALTAQSDKFGEVYPGIFSTLWLFSLPSSLLMIWRTMPDEQVRKFLPSFFIAIFGGALVLIAQPYYRYIMPSVIATAAISGAVLLSQPRWIKYSTLFLASVGMVGFIGSQGWFERDIYKFLQPAPRAELIDKFLGHIQAFQILNNDRSVSAVFIVPATLTNQFGLLKPSYQNNIYSKLVANKFALLKNSQDLKSFMQEFEITHFLVRSNDHPLILHDCAQFNSANHFDILKCDF